MLSCGVKVNSSDPLPIIKIGIITDVHIGEDGSPERLSGFIETMNQWKPDFVIDLGDAASGFVDNATGRYTTIADLDKYRMITNALTMPIYRVVGNHDIDNDTSIADWIKHTNAPSDQYTFIHGGYQFIIINTQLDSEYISTWLMNNLSPTDMPKIIFGHIPLFSELRPDVIMPNAEKITSVLEASENVSMCFFGHSHLNEYFEKNGIRYYTLDSSDYLCNDSYSALTIYPDDSIWLKGYGKQVDYDSRLPIEYTITNQTFILPIQSENTTSNQTQDFIGCRVFCSKSSIVNSGTTPSFINFDYEFYDTDNIHTNSNNMSGVLVCRTEGYYNIFASINYMANAVGVRQCYIEKNGVLNICEDQAQNCGDAYSVTLNLSTVYYLKVGDYVRLGTFQNSGVALMIRSLPEYSPVFGMQRMD